MVTMSKFVKSIAVVALAIGVYAGGLAMVGCQPTPVSTSLERIDGGANAIQRSATDIGDHADKVTGVENQPHKEAIKKDVSSILIDAKGIHFDSGKAKEGDAAKDKVIKGYRENPLVSIAVFIWTWGKVFFWAFVVLGTLAVIAYALAFIGGLFNPATAMFRLSQEMVRLVPLGNIVRWAHNILGKKTATVPATIVPVVPPPAVVTNDTVQDSNFAAADAVASVDNGKVLT